MKFRKKPVIIEAWKVDRSSPIPLFVAKGCNDGFVHFHFNEKELTAIVDTLEGQMLCREGDYLIKGVKGEFYPCKPDIFEETYEPVGD